MVLPDNVNPESSILYLSSFIIDSLNSTKDKLSVGSLYDKVKDRHDMSIHEYLLCLDWLFLMDMAQTDKNGAVSLCS